MSKQYNHRGKLSHNTRRGEVDLTKKWKYGKSNGHPNPEIAKARRERKGKKRLKS